MSGAPHFEKGKKKDVHPRGMMVSCTFGLVLFLDHLLRRSTDNNVPETSATGCMDRLARSGTRFRFGRGGGHVACTATAMRMLPIVWFS
jgi:hypothetical protein